MARMQMTHMLAAFLLLVLHCQGAPTPGLSSASGNAIRLPLRRSVVRDVEELHRRDVSASLTNTKIIYTIDLEIGSPPQDVQLILDTGSSEVWAFPPSICTTCGGSYDPDLSRTVEAADSVGPFNQGYADGSSATGYYVTDKIQLGATEVTEVYIGVPTSATFKGSGHGTMGLSFDATENTPNSHPGIMDTLLSQKLISSNSYSIFLDDLEATDTGSIIFGGIDNSKYSGQLQYLDIIQHQNANDRPGLNVPWTSLTVTNGTGWYADLPDSSFPIPALLDTGSTLSTVPYTIFWQLYSYFGATGPDNGIAYVDCDMPSGYLTFGFGDGPAVQIDVPFSELAIPVGSDKCWFGLQPQSGNGPGLSLADTFIRSAYMHVNFDNNQIGLAQSSRS